MEPEFTTREKITVLGLMERFTPENEDYEGIWKRYMAYHNQIRGSSIDGGNYHVQDGSPPIYAIIDRWRCFCISV